MNYKQFINNYLQQIRDKTQDSSNYLKENREGKVLLEELVGLIEDWDCAYQRVTERAQDVGILGRSAMVDYMQTMFFTLHQWLIMTLLMGYIESCFYTLRILLEGNEAALGLDSLQEYKGQSYWKIIEKNRERSARKKILCNLRRTRPDLHEELKTLYSSLSENWVHSTGYFIRKSREAKSSKEIPSWALYLSTLARERMTYLTLLITLSDSGSCSKG